MLRMSPAPSTDRTFSPTLAGPRTRYRKIRKWCNRKKGKKQNPRGYSVLIIGSARGFLLCRNIACDISGISTKAPCEAALMCERHVRIEISDFVMRTFVLADTTAALLCLFLSSHRPECHDSSQMSRPDSRVAASILPDLR